MSEHDSWFTLRTMQALEAVAFGPLTTAQVAAVLGVHPRTARRMLNRLVRDGYLARTGPQERQYEPTMRIVAIAAQIVARSRLARTAVPFVARLHGGDATGHLLVPSYRNVLCLVHGAGDAEASPQLGELAPAHGTAGGKVLLAWREPWRESVLSQPLERHTDRTTTTADALLRDLAATHERGYALEHEEHREGVCGVAAPVFSAEGEAVAALSMTARADVDGEAERVVAVAGELSAALEARDG